MKKILSFILTLTVISSAIAGAYAQETNIIIGTQDVEITTTVPVKYYNPFPDVSESDWFYEDLMYAVLTGLVNGKTDTTYCPYDNLTYAEAIKLAACMNQLYTEGTVSLKNGDPWYITYADYCRENKIISKDYDYSAFATRAGYMEIFAKALPEKALEEINTIAEDSIPDVPSSAPYADAVYKLYRVGVVTGVDEQHNCNPEANITRAEVAVIVARMMNADKRIRFDLGEEVIEKIYDNDYIIVEEDDGTENKTEVYEQPGITGDEPINILPEQPEVTEKIPTQTVTPGIAVTPTKPVEGSGQPIADTPLTIHKQPQGSDCAEYGTKYELEVQVFGGKAPYTYEWQYNGYRNQKTKIENGDYVKDADSAALVLSVEKENTLLGTAISCKITDSEGKTVTTETVKVYGPFSMTVDDWTLDSGKNTLIGKVSDGILKKGEKVSVIRNGKVIATGVADDLQMFNKSLDETAKGDNVGIVFNKEKGVLPSKGDIVVKYQPSHIVDTSDVIN